MKKILLFIVLFTNINYFCFAQQDERVKKTEAIEIAFITKELGLTPNEAQKFWPVFNNYRNEIKTIKKGNPDIVAVQEQIVNIRKKYKVEFKKVIPDDKRVNKVFKAETDFVNMLQKELQTRKKDDIPRQRGNGNKKF